MRRKPQRQRPALTASLLAKISGRFWSKVNKNGPIPDGRLELGPCWEWTASTRPFGYGQFGIWISPYTYCFSAHQIALAFYGRKVPQGKEPDHLCRNSACIRDSHLDVVSHRVNMQRGAATLRTRCPKGHPYDAANTIITKQGHRQCRTCKLRADAKWGRVHREERTDYERKYRKTHPPSSKYCARKQRRSVLRRSIQRATARAARGWEPWRGNA